MASLAASCIVRAGRRVLSSQRHRVVQSTVGRLSVVPRFKPAVATVGVRCISSSIGSFGQATDAVNDEGGINVYTSDTHRYPAPAAASQGAVVSSMEQYEALHKRSIEDPAGFWGDVGKTFEWFQTWDKVCHWDLAAGDIRWFEGAKLNVTVNCLDRHVAAGRGDAPAMTFEADDGESHTYSYQEMLDNVSQYANVLRENGVGKGDRVTIYMSMTPQLAFAVLACARIGAIHSVVFGGFSAEALADRIVNCESHTVVTCDAGVRGGRALPLKSVVDEAAAMASGSGVEVAKVLVTHRAGEGVGSGAPGWVEGRDVDLDAAAAAASTTAPAEVMDAEDPLFILYTSGSTGKPKGVLHTQAGYMVYAAETFRNVFDHRGFASSDAAATSASDVHFCTADIGWITGHSYILYGPLANGAHTVVFEGVPTYPSPARLWEICDKHKVTTFYTAPTAIRALMIHGDEPVNGSALDSVRILGTVGEPINPEAWQWYHRVVGKEALPIVDTWWQTETGGMMLTPLPGATTTKPGCATRPFFGVNPRVVDMQGNDVGVNKGGFLAIDAAWPGMMRSVYKNHERFIETYLSQIPGMYFTGDGARIDEDGDVWILGRTDDVLNVSGHRLSTAEIESALVLHEAVVEAAVVGRPDKIKGQGIYCFVTLRGDKTASEEMRKELVAGVRQHIGAIASPDVIQFTAAMPKTRSGKIMRRVLRKVAAGDVDDLGDTSTLAEPAVVDTLIAESKAL